jgi:hypothetical protein
LQKVAERLLALGFALEQLHQHFSDLERCVHEAARSFAGKRKSQANLHGIAPPNG